MQWRGTSSGEEKERALSLRVAGVRAGFAFARLKFFGSNIVFFVLLAGLLLPAEVFIIPLYFNLRSAHVTDSYWALILPQIAQSLAFFQGQHATDYSLLAAAGIIIAAPIVVLYFFLQKRFISGMLDGISSR
jgi:ABC-type glycerol-3-phosphate transport system permease component